ncbi:LOW QUALITY PROTEIN: Reverse transcriptase [Phytophthora palmivora]|uniref:Reverse transcriptase n=1 Tax=Phytophthora palmivora TaxID=4796 RepID=A0A2P4Y666_9STRA|nr:LOW QUALITY PROTEIN: Reverse transcriptase [Phytophthora palmivora]
MRDIHAGADSAPLPAPMRVMAAITRCKHRRESDQQGPMGPVEYQAERWRHIIAQQDGDSYLMNLKKFLRDLPDLKGGRIVRTGRPTHIVSFEAIHPRKDKESHGWVEAIPQSLRSDMLHYVHEDFQGGHQSFTSSVQIFIDMGYVETYVKEGTDCASGKGRPPNQGLSPGNIELTRPFEDLYMDFITHLPESERGNIFLLLFQDMFLDLSCASR